MPEEGTSTPMTDSSPMEEHIRELRSNSERILIRLVTTVSRICTMHAARATDSFGMSISQMVVLGEIFRHNGCRQEDLRTFVMLDKGNVTRALQHLEKSGLVERTQDPSDRRVVRVHFTEKALSIEHEMYRLATIWDDLLTAGFTPEEHEMLLSLLVRVEDNARRIAKSGAIARSLDSTPNKE